jgi:serine O-acetyltransferase
MDKPVTFVSLLTGVLSINVMAVIIWRLSMYAIRKRLYPVAMLLYYLNIVLFSFDATPYSLVGPGLVVAHLSGCVLHGKIGKNCTLYGRNVLGGLGEASRAGWLGGPVLADNVTMGIGSSVLGPVSVGSDSTVGAGAWCFKDVEPSSIVVGMPAKLLRYKNVGEVDGSYSVDRKVS